jgi:hypothetical protein
MTIIFASLASKSVVTVSSGLTSKPAATVSNGLALKLAAMVSSGLASKPPVMIPDGLASKPAMTIFWFGSPNRQLRFNDLGLKITAMVFGLDLKIKRILVCRLHHKTDGGSSARYTHQDQAASFACKQVCLGFASLA